MIGVTQRRTGAPRGQCTEASVATVLGVALEDVPDLWVLSGRPEGGVEVDRSAGVLALWAWLKAQGVLWAWGDFSERPCPLDWRCFGELFADLPWEGLHLLGGPNPDGVPHMVVAQGGRVVWDPNPSRRGIVACDGAGFLLPLESVPPKWRGLPGVELRFELALEGP